MRPPNLQENAIRSKNVPGRSAGIDQAGFAALCRALAYVRRRIHKLLRRAMLGVMKANAFSHGTIESLESRIAPATLLRRVSRSKLMDSVRFKSEEPSTATVTRALASQQAFAPTRLIHRWFEPLPKP
jgi:hypothetical protein